MTPFGNIPASSVLPIFFDTFAGSTGAPITMTNFATSDILVYKGTSMTQRASTAGFTLLDTDGIDLDGITGIQGFSIDLSDNTDAGFYAAGSFYTVVISTVTVDSQTMSFIAATFRIVAAENTAGTPVVDTGRIAGTAQTAKDLGAINVTNLNTLSGHDPGATLGTSTLTQAQVTGGAYALQTDASGYSKLSTGTGTGQLDFTSGVVKSNLVQILGTALTETAGQIAAAFKKFFNIATPASTMDALTLVATATNLTNAPTSGDFTATMKTSIGTAVDGSTTGTDAAAIKVQTDKLTFTVANKLDANVYTWNGTAVSTPATAGIPEVNVKNINNVSASAVTTVKAIQGLTTADTIATYTGNTKQTGDNYARLGAPAGASVSADVAAIKSDTGSTLTDAAAIKTVTDQFVFTVANQVDANALTGGGGLDAAGVRTAVGLASANLDTQLAALPTATENADALLNRDMSAVTVTNTRSPINALRALRNKVDLAATPGIMLVMEEDDSTTAWSAALTTDATADPITIIDPA